MYLVIPSEVLFNKDLTPTEKMIYSLVISLQSNSQECYFSNSQLSEIIGVSVSSINRAIKKLEDLKLIDIYYSKPCGRKSNRNLTLELNKLIQVQKERERGLKNE